jgi:aspartyl-tRNA(Asn)/glutamyl-tRNA(Gln) amidotransferase subunit A
VTSETAPPKRIGVLTGLEDLDPAVKSAHIDAIELLKDNGFDVVEVTLPVLDYVVPAYYTIATAEASANLARYTGIRYGHRAKADNIHDLVKKSRTEGFGDEVKLRILLGTYVLRSGFQDQYYIRAQKIRTAIRNGFDDIFASVDLMMMPVFPSRAFPHGASGLTPFQQKLADKFTASANMAGIPAMAFPTGIANGLPIGMQFLAPPLAEERLFKVFDKLASSLPDVRPEGYSAEPWRS